MRKCGWKTALVLFLLFLIPFFNPMAEAGTGSIRAKIVLPGDTGAAGATIPLSIGIQPMGYRPLDGGDGGGGDGGGSGGGGGDSGGDGGYSDIPWNPIPPVTISEDRILKLENLNAGLYNLILQYGRESKNEYQLAMKNVRVLEGQVTDLKDLLMKKGGTITGSIRFAGRSDFPTATVHVVGFAGTNASTLPPWLNNRTISATDLSGKFTLTNLPEGTYTLAITPGGVAAATHAREVITNIRVVADQTISATPFGPFELTSTMGALSGWVGLFDRPSGPYDGTFIRATSTDGRFRSYIQVTDSDGYYDFGKIPIGSYHMYIQHAGYKVSESDFTLSSPGSAQADVVLRRGTKKICGHVAIPGLGYQRGDISGDNKVGIADAILALQTTSGVKTSPNVAGDINNDVKIGLAEAIFALQTAAELRLPSGSLGGTLVMIPGTSLMASTDAAGNFTIEGIPERSPSNWTYDLFVSREGYQAIRQENVDAAIETCTSGNLSFTLAPHETVTVGGKVVAKGSIMGRAWLKKSTDDYRNIDVAIENTGFVAKPNAFGNFIFTDVPPGTYKLNYTNAGYKTVAEAGVLVVPNLTTETRNVVLIPRNGTIKGQIKLEGAMDWSNIPIRVEPVEAQIAGYKTDLNGYFSIPVTENYNVLTNTKCVLNNTTGDCTGSASYTVVAGGGVWAQTDYQPYTFANVNVPAGETVDLGAVELKKPPAAPSGVAAAQKDGSSVTVSWTPSSSTDVTGYNVYYGTQSDAINQKANAALIATQTGGKWQFTVTGLEKGTPYYFVAQAVDSDNLPSAKAPGDGSCTWTLVPQGANIPEVLCANCSFDSAILTDIALVGDGSKGYVSSSASTSVYLIDFSTGMANESDKIVIGAGAEPRALAYNPVRNELYVVNATIGSASLRTIDTSKNTLKNSSIAVGAAPKNVIVSPDGTTIYVCSSYSDQNRVTVIDATTMDAATGAVTATIPLSNIDPYGMAIAANKLYVVGQSNGRVYVIDLNSRTVIKNISAGVGAYDAIARPDGAFIYVSLNDNIGGAIAVIDTATDQLVGSPIPVGMNPQGMAVSGNILYVTNYYGTNQISMINTATNTKLETGAIASGGTGPKALAVSPDGNKLYVVHEGSVTIVSY